AASLHDHARRGEAKFGRCHKFNARRFQGESKYAKRVPESGATSREMISSVIFDLDGTLTMVPSPWQYVHERLGIWDTTACHYLNEWIAGQISYEEFCRRDTSLWNGRTVDEIHAFLDEIGFNRHVPAVVEHLVERRIPSIIISSGFKYVAAKIQRQ